LARRSCAREARSPDLAGQHQHMSVNGTAAYNGLLDLPPLVQAAVDQARYSTFGLSCLPAHGRLLQILAGGIDSGTIGETGTGCGVGLAWLASGARPGTRLVSIERELKLVQAARQVFKAAPQVEVLHGDWTELREQGPFDLLVVDGGGQGKAGEAPLDPEQWMRAGGLVVIDDFTPSTSWPPLYDGRHDTARLHWLEHPRLLATMLRTQPDAAAVLATYRG